MQLFFEPTGDVRKHLGFVRLHQQLVAGAGVEFRLDVPDTGIPEALDGPPDSGGALAHRVGVTGEEEKRQESMNSLMFALVLSVILVYMVLASQFESLLHPFTILLTIPLAVVGAILLFFLTGTTINMMGVIGIVMLVGIAVNNSIILVDRINQLKQSGMELTDAIVESGQQRIRPILMTTLTTVLAMVTMLFGTDMASEMSTGMAIVIIGGLSYATLMTLFVVPVLYDLFYRRPPVNIDVGDDGLDDLPDDAAEFAAEFAARRAAEAASAPRRPDLSRAARAPEENDGEKKEADHDNG